MDKITVGDYRYNPKAGRLITKTLQSGRLTYGPLSRQFERKFAKLHEVDCAILCSSGTDALRIALRTLKIKNEWEDGALVFLPALTFVATLNVIIDEGLTPVLIDVDPVHYHISPMHLERAMEYHRKKGQDLAAVLPVHLFGQPVRHNDIAEIVKYWGNGLTSILEDSCECMFAEVGGRMVGGLGDMAAFSTYAAHLVTTGVGGIVTTNKPELAELARSLANHGRDGIYISIDDDKEGGKEVIERRFRFNHRGFSSRITELQAAVGLPQLDTLPQDIEIRQYNAKRLTEALTPLKDVLRLPSVRADNSHSFMMYPLVLEDGDKWDLINFLEENDIETREMLPLTNQPAYKSWINEDDYPAAAFINKQGFYVGCHQYLGDTQMDYIAAMLRMYFRR